MPSDCGNGLAMRIGFLLDSYAERFAVDLAVDPVAGGVKELTPVVRARTRNAIVLPFTTPDMHFALIASVADPDARLAAFRQYGRPSITSLLSEKVRLALRTFSDERSYALV